MKRRIKIPLIIFAVLALPHLASADGCTLAYNLKPGQKWRCAFTSRSETTVMGQKNTNQSKQTYDYVVSKGPKNNWVTVTARIVTKGADAQSGMNLSKLVFTADVHTSGEIRNIQYSGDVMPTLENADQIPEEMKKMMQASYKMIPEAYKHAIFWFPEVPEYRLEIGDEFDVKRTMGAGGTGTDMQMQTVSIQSFTLEEVSKGLAYFSVKQRSVTKTKGVAGGSADTKIAGKGEAVFDLEQGMWLELTEKSLVKVNLSGVAGMGNRDQDMHTIHAYEMEKH
jgi:hypothetical protein